MKLEFAMEYLSPLDIQVKERVFLVDQKLQRIFYLQKAISRKIEFHISYISVEVTWFGFNEKKHFWMAFLS